MSKLILNNGEIHTIGEDFTPDIQVIARALSNINRYNGHVGTYSVAQHCVLVASNIVTDDPRVNLSALLHDAPEAYIGDVASPLKSMLPEYKKIEQFYHDVIDKYYGVTTQCDAVKLADLRMLITEAKSFGLPLEHFPVIEPYDIVIKHRWEPKFAERMFLLLFNVYQKSDIK